jgi:integrase
METKAAPEILETINSRLKKGEGWIGYRYSNDHEGNRLQSRYLYYAFYVNGVQKFVNTKTNDAEDAYRQLLAAHGGVERGVTVLPSESGRITYQHLRASYIADDPARADAHQLKYLDKFFSNMKATAITTETLRSYITHRRKHVAGPTIRRELVLLRAMFRLALKSKQLSYDNVPWFPMPEDSLATGQYITPEQFDKIRSFLPDGSKRESENGGPKSTSNLRPFFTFLYATACRLGAAESLTWKNVSEDCMVVEIPASGTKNKQPLRLPLKGKLLEPVVKELRKQKSKTNAEGVIEFRNENRPVFDSTNYRPEWAKACAKAGIGTWEGKARTRTGVRIHDCRCSGAINLLASGVDEGLVLKIGGWKTRSMLDRYNIADITRLSAAMEKGGKFVTDRIAVAEATR